MALHEPAWLVKSRPCPFYQQGRCLFADSCNFVHSASVRVSADGASLSKRNSVGQTPLTPSQIPVVTVNSPSSARSPPRSPRLSGLLFALRDVIGDDPEDEEQFDNTAEEHSQSVILDTDNWSSGLPTLVNDNGFPYSSQESPTESSHFEENYTQSAHDNSYSSHSSPHSSPHILDENSGSESLDDYIVAETEDDTHHTQSQSFLLDESDGLPSEHVVESVEQVVETPAHIADRSSHLLSPVDLSNLHLGPFLVENNHDDYYNSFDSGYADSFKPPAAPVPVPPRSPAPNSTFELLGSPFGSPSHRILSPGVSAFIGRSPVSPLRKNITAEDKDDAQPSAENDLDSPTDYKAKQRAHEEQTARMGEGTLRLTPMFTPRNEEALLSPSHSESPGRHDDSSDEEYEQEDSMGSTALWDAADAAATAVFVGLDEQVNQEVRRLSSSSTEFLDNDKSVAFVPEEAEANSSVVANASTETGSLEVTTEPPFEEEPAGDVLEDYHEEVESEQPVEPPVEEEPFGDVLADYREEDDSTAHLAYLASPTAVLDEGDTLTSLYDVYTSPPVAEHNSPTPQRTSAFSSPRVIEKKLSSSSSTPSSLLRERVFTPPSNWRERSGTVTADSPTSLASPVTSLDSQSKGRISPFSIRSPSPRITGETSKKVPFGFRHSAATGKSERVSLISNRTSRSILPSIQREGDPVLNNEEPPKRTSTLSPPSPVDSGTRLRPLRLSVLLDGANLKSTSPRISTSSSLSSHLSGNQARISMSSVSSGISLSNNNLLSSPRSSLIPLHLRNTQHMQSPSPLSSEFAHHNLGPADEPQSAPAHSQTWRSAPSLVTRSNPLTTRDRRSSHYSEPSLTPYDELVEHDSYDETIRRPLDPPPNSAPISHSRPTSIVRPPMYAIATPPPTLMFAIASDDVDQVRQVLERGDAGPNDAVGPQSALEFAITNDQLTHKMEIVKTLLAFGADPTVARKPTNPGSASSSKEQNSTSEESNSLKSLVDGMDPATRYYVERADAAHTRRSSALIHRSFFRPLTRVRYELIGQDRALEQLFRVLSMHSRQLSAMPIVVLLSGPSGHGKSLLARKFGSLLDVPTHTVNMTTLRSTHDLWQSYSMSPYETPTTCTLAEFLINNEGKRCVVVLDEIEKTENEKTLSSLLMPWELGRCCFEANSRHIDVRNVIWIGTSNIAHDLIFEHHEARERSYELMSREEYVELMGLTRPRVSDRLGASVLSRVTTVLPFVPFTLDEKKAICSEALYNLGGELVRDLSPKVIESVIDMALASYIPSEGARSLYRAISNQLVDMV